MKQFIVAAAILPILMLFAFQFTAEEIRHSRTLRLEELVHEARLEAAEAGGFSPELKERVANEAAAILKVPTGDIMFESQRDPERPDKYILYSLRCGKTEGHDGGFVAEMLSPSGYAVSGKVYLFKPHVVGDEP